ncbi:alpha-ribazole phosphatase [Paraburkholderia sartisoli]|uniref:Alpha-ribazole phosphatase n=1 Tax=Paraburkholderia sartisoli TaxID=83784 RepID=A0A1H4CBK7_9BURK|nr:alpha-ribazole phosphatase [Paraburkholderia sartisoli]SEA57720.1 alpha-ribazole phosphatase [Paraburkholderia sartisoli]
MDLVLIRHPAVAIDAGVCYGRSDVALADAPLASVAALEGKLKLPAPDVVWSSPLTRCRSIAEPWAAQWARQVSVDPRLQEMDFGAWEQQRWDDIDRALLDDWAADLHHARAHGGESVAQFGARVATWFDERQTEAGDGCAHVVTHAGVIRVLASLALRVPLEQTLLWSIDFAGVVWLRRREPGVAWTLVRWNA